MLAQATGKMSGPHKYDVGTNLLSDCCTCALPLPCLPPCVTILAPPMAKRGSLIIQDAKIAKKLPYGHHRTTLSAYIFATKAHIDNRKNVLNSIIFPTCPHNMANFGPVAAEIGSLAWDTQANFNGFRVLVLLLQRRRSTEANQTLHDVWPSTARCKIHFASPIQVLRSRILVALLHDTRLVGVSQTLRR